MGLTSFSKKEEYFNVGGIKISNKEMYRLKKFFPKRKSGDGLFSAS
jgi:hypothetical protein